MRRDAEGDNYPLEHYNYMPVDYETEGVRTIILISSAAMLSIGFIFFIYAKKLFLRGRKPLEIIGVMLMFFALLLLVATICLIYNFLL